MSRVCDITGKKPMFGNKLAMLIIKVDEGLILIFKKRSFGCQTRIAMWPFGYQLAVCV